MKKLLLFSIIVSGFSIAASAQTDRKFDSTKRRPPMEGRMREDNQQMIKDLNLTQAQQDQFKKNNEELRTKMQTLRDNTALTQDEKRSQMKAIRDEQKTKMDALLTADQKTKWEASRKKMMEERKNTPPPPPPAADIKN